MPSSILFLTANSSSVILWKTLFKSLEPSSFIYKLWITAARSWACRLTGAMGVNSVNAPLLPPTPLHLSTNSIILSFRSYWETMRFPGLRNGTFLPAMFTALVWVGVTCVTERACFNEQLSVGNLWLTRTSMFRMEKQLALLLSELVSCQLAGPFVCSPVVFLEV